MVYGALNELSQILFAQGNLRLCEDMYASYKDRINQEIPTCPKSQIVFTTNVFDVVLVLLSHGPIKTV